MERLFPNPKEFEHCGFEKNLYDIAKRQKDCYIGITLSQNDMLSSVALIFPMQNDFFYIFTQSFISDEQRKNESSLSRCWEWESKGLLMRMWGYKRIFRYLGSLKEQLNLNFLGIGIDPHNAGGVMEDLEEFDCPVVTITQSARSLNDATLKFALCAKQLKCAFDNRNELLKRSVLRANIVENSFGEVKVAKNLHAGNSRCEHTSPVDAIINAFALIQMVKT